MVYALKELTLHLNFTLDLLIVSEDELKGAQVVVLPRPGCVTRGMGGSQVVVLPRPWLCYQGKGPYCLFIAIYLFDVPVAMCDERIMWIPAGGLCYP